MSAAVLIAISFSIGFFFESILGFGGGIIAYTILSFFVDLKVMILAGLYIGTCSSAYIFYTDHKSFDKDIFKSLIPLSFAGTVLGVMCFSFFSSPTLSIILGVLLILLAIKTLFFEKYTFPKIFKNKLLFTAGISQGAFGIGGPFAINALKTSFKNKSGLRTTMASFFVFFNLVRVVQLTIQKQLHLDFFSEIWWVIIPIFASIWLGYKVHLKISEDLFKKGIGIMTIFAGIKFILQ